MRVRAWIRSFFAFSRTETNAFLVLVPLMIIIIFSEPIYEAWFTSDSSSFPEGATTLDSLFVQWKEEKKKDSLLTAAKTLFAFDPNKTSKEDFLLLGFSESQANRIIHYRTKGGTFRIKSDLLKMYGMDSLFYVKLSPYIQLPEIYASTKSAALQQKQTAAQLKQDLNLADSTALIKVYGIGSKLSQRIVKYREKLGGFIMVKQLREVYGLDSAVIERIESKFSIDQNFKPRLLNINASDEKILASHPYIGYKLAKAMAAYRFQHGEFQSIEDLRKIAVIKEEAFLKMKPYLSINQ